MQLIGYCDAAWGNLDSGKTRGCIFLALSTTIPQGRNEQFCPANWHARRLQRVVRSTFAGKTLLASEALDEVIYTAEIWSELGNGTVRTTLRADSGSLYEHLHLKGLCKEKRLTVELNALKEALDNGQLVRLEWVETEKQLANGLTKHMTALLMLRTLD